MTHYALALVVVLSLLPQTETVPTPGAEIQARGSHAMNTLVSGQKFTHEDVWTLSRLDSSRLQVTGEIAMSDEQQRIPYTVELDENLRLRSWRVAGPNGSLEFRLDEAGFTYLDVDKQGKTDAQTQQVPGPFTLLMPALPWALPRLIADANGSSEPVAVRLIFPDAEHGRTSFELLEATVRFAGTEEIEVRATPITAERYELRSEGLNLDIWASEEGFVLAYQDAKRPEQRLELERFERLGEALPSLSTLSK